MLGKLFERIFNGAGTKPQVQSDVVYADLFELLLVARQRAMAGAKPEMDRAWSLIGVFGQIYI